MGRWVRGLAMPALLLVAGGCGDSVTTPEPQSERFVDAFDVLWSTFDAEYSYFVYKDIDWAALRAEYRPRAETVTSLAELLDVLEAMTLELRDGHVWFRSPSGQTVRQYTSGAFRNWDRDVWRSYVAGAGWQQVENWGHGWFGRVGYIAIGAWSDAFEIADFDAVLEQHRDDPALILDVRMNGGGSDLLARNAAARFVARERVIDYFAFRDGPAHDDFEPTRPRTISPRGDWQFTRPVAVLSGRGAASSSESFVSAMREIPHATVLGDTTAGSSGNPGYFDLLDGWQFTVSRWLHWDADMRMIEWQGIPPDIAVRATDADFSAGRDPVIDFALEWIADRITQSALAARPEPLVPARP